MEPKKTLLSLCCVAQCCMRVTLYLRIRRFPIWFRFGLLCGCMFYRHRNVCCTNTTNVDVYACVYAIHAFHFKQMNTMQTMAWFVYVCLCVGANHCIHIHIHTHKLLFSLILFCYRHSYLSRATWSFAVSGRQANHTAVVIKQAMA